jgi:hypothetical protein
MIADERDSKWQNVNAVSIEIKTISQLFRADDCPCGRELCRHGRMLN